MSTPKKLTANLWCLPSRSMRYNAGVLISAGRAWLIDPGPHHDEIAAAAELASNLGVTLERVALTHYHWDHILGPERLPGVPVLAYDGFDQTLSANLERTLAMIARWEQRCGYGRDRPFAPPRPSETVGDGQRVALGELELLMLHVPGHAPDQLAIFEPASGALWAADTLSNYEIPFISHSLAAYEESLAKLAPLAIRALVPGHGDPSDDPRAIRARIDEDRAYLDELRARVTRVVAAGGTVEAAVEACASMRFREPGENSAPHRLNVESVYIELGGDASPDRVGWAQKGLFDRSRARQLAAGTPGLPAVALLWAGAALAVVWLCWRVLLPAALTHSFGFSSYYTAAHLVAGGRFGPEIYDNTWFQAQELALGLRNDIYGTQPPTMALLLLPVVWLPPAAARVAWLALDMLWLAGIAIVAAGLARSAGARVGPAAVAAMVILVAVYRPLHAELRYAQVYVLLGLWYALWLYGFVTGRDWLCGAALAALALAKLAGAPLWIVLLFDRRWRALGWATGLGAAGLLLSLPLIGLDTWWAYLFGRVGELAADPIFGVTALQTLTGLLRQLFVFDARYTPAPLVHAPWLASLIWVAVATTLAWLTLAPAARRHDSQPSSRGLHPSSFILHPASFSLHPSPRNRLLTGAAALCLIVPLQPAGEQHHYVVLLVPLLLLVPLAGRLAREAPAAAALAALAVGLLLLPSYFLDNAAWAGWPRALLAYPRLYAALALWGCLVLWRGARDTRPLQRGAHQ